MSEFSGYEKMPNSFEKLGLSESEFAELNKLQWVVTEKVHGANFSFVYQNNNLKYAKRKEYLSWTDDFFGFQLIVNKLEKNIFLLFEKLNTQIQGSKYIIYGELFGGKYPHPEVPQIKDFHAIQTGVYYTPSIEFCAFDIAIQTDDTLESKYYLDYEMAISYFKQFGIFYAKPLFIGKFNEAMNFNTRINSTIAKDLNLPELKENLIEGVVIKPYSQRKTISSRPIIKLKNSEFEEDKKFHQAEKWSYIPKISSNAENLSFIMDELRNYVNLNRLESVVSKIGTLDFNNENRVSEIKKEFLEDVITDFNENNNELFNILSPEENEWIVERVKFEINKTIASAKS